MVFIPNFFAFSNFDPGFSPIITKAVPFETDVATIPPFSFIRSDAFGRVRV